MSRKYRLIGPLAWLVFALASLAQAPARADVIDDFLGGGGPLTSQPWFELTPSFHGAFDWNRELINQTPNPDPNNLHAYEFGGGFMVTRKRVVEAGVGPTFDWNFLDPGAVGLIPYVGILPMVGTRVIEVRYAPSEEAAKQLPTIRASIVPRYLRTWRAGDHITYQVSGGVLFSAGLSFYGLGASARYLAKGDWIVYVEKLEGDEAYVKITKTKLQSFSMNAGAAVLGVSAEWFRNADNYFSYVVNLNDDHAVKAFADLLLGNLTEAQALAERPGSPIRLDTSARVEQAGRRTRFWYGLTFLLGGEISQGRLTTLDNEWHHADGVKVKVQHGVWFKENMARVFLKKERQVEAFYATHNSFTRSQGPEDEPFRIYSGTYYFTYENNRTKTDELSDALRYLARRTGLGRELALGMPSQKKLKSTLTQFSFTLSSQATDALVSLHFDKQLGRLDQAARRAMDRYFATGDSEGICRRKSLSRCRENYADETADALDEMKDAIERMGRAIDMDEKEFVKAYAEFGRLFARNRFTFQAVMDAVDGSPLTVTLAIQGPKVNRFERKIGIDTDTDRTRQKFIEWKIHQVATGAK